MRATQDDAAASKDVNRPTASVAPQLAHVQMAVVMSEPNTSWGSPATALPSRINASISAFRRSKALGLYPLRLVAEMHQRFGHRPPRTASGLRWPHGRRPGWGDLRQHVGVDAAGIAHPAGQLRRTSRRPAAEMPRVSVMGLHSCMG
jgi:hypothetical protein